MLLHDLFERLHHSPRRLDRPSLLLLVSVTPCRRAPCRLREVRARVSCESIAVGSLHHGAELPRRELLRTVAQLLAPRLAAGPHLGIASTTRRSSRPCPLSADGPQFRVYHWRWSTTSVVSSPVATVRPLAPAYLTKWARAMWARCRRHGFLRRRWRTPLARERADGDWPSAFGRGRALGPHGDGPSPT